MAGVDAKKQKEIEDIFTLADQRLAAKESRALEKKGGYQFQSLEVKTDALFMSHHYYVFYHVLFILSYCF